MKAALCYPRRNTPEAQKADKKCRHLIKAPSTYPRLYQDKRGRRLPMTGQTVKGYVTNRHFTTYPSYSIVHKRRRIGAGKQTQPPPRPPNTPRPPNSATEDAPATTVDDRQSRRWMSTPNGGSDSGRAGGGGSGKGSGGRGGSSGRKRVKHGNRPAKRARGWCSAKAAGPCPFKPRAPQERKTAKKGRVAVVQRVVLCPASGRDLKKPQFARRAASNKPG